MKDIPTTKGIREKFRLNVKPSHYCWEWMGAKDPNGYGVVCYGGTYYLAHRVAYRIHRGPIEDGLFVLHECDNPCCVNPMHLKLGTAKDNAEDSARRGRRFGEAHRIKLTPRDAKAIRQLYATRQYTQGKIADLYNVSRQTINSIVNMRCWRTVEEQ